LKTNTFGRMALITCGVVAFGCGSDKKSNTAANDGKVQTETPVQPTTSDAETASAVETILVSETQNGQIVTISYTSNDPKALFECKVEREGQPTANWNTCPSVAAHQIQLGGAGTWIVQIRAKNLRGAVDETPISRTYRYQPNGGGNDDGAGTPDRDYCKGKDDNGQYDNGQHDNGQHNNGQYDHGQYKGKGPKPCKKRPGKDDNGQYDKDKDNGQYDKDNGQHDNGQYDKDNGQYEDGKGKDCIVIFYDENGQARERRDNRKGCESPDQGTNTGY
jgi:hypothetical protein